MRRRSAGFALPGVHPFEWDSTYQRAPSRQRVTIRSPDARLPSVPIGDIAITGFSRVSGTRLVNKLGECRRSKKMENGVIPAP